MNKNKAERAPRATRKDQPASGRSQSKSQSKKPGMASADANHLNRMAEEVDAATINGTDTYGGGGWTGGGPC